ncbi:hypothetical protein GQ54DRAFT_314566 [Martensiomyces pterosporus]|nr:hypothetical protein GQ54DRAFT_314566 [Martensiomyces pterosporus]
MALPLHGRAAHRRLWVVAASADPTMKAAVGQCVGRIRSALAAKQLPSAGADGVTGAPTSGGQAASCFALISQTYSASDIDQVACELKHQLSGISPGVHVSGSVVDHVVSSDGSCHTPGLSILYHTPQGGSQLAGRPFYIGDAHGRQRLRETAVGRWHNEITDRHRPNDQTIHWKRGVSSATQAESYVSLPQELTKDISNPSCVRLLLFASDKESRQVLDALDARFPAAVKLGIVGSQTPFLNACDFTLFCSSRMYDGGVVGFVFEEQGSEELNPGNSIGQPDVAHDGLEEISGAFRIERAKGNVVLDLENGEAARTLIASIRKRRQQAGNAEMDGRLFAKITGGKDADSSAKGNWPAVFQVTGGDPAKGGLAVDTSKDIAAGQYIQFMMPRPTAARSRLADDREQLMIRFYADDYSSPEGTRAVATAGSAVFGGVTEGGFIYSTLEQPLDPNQASSSNVLSGTTECSVPGSVASLTLH